MMAMREYPTVLMVAENPLPRESDISILAKNVDREVSQWRRALRVMTGIAYV